MYPTLFSVDYPLHLTSSLTTTLLFLQLLGEHKGALYTGSVFPDAFESPKCYNGHHFTISFLLYFLFEKIFRSI